MVGRGTRLAPGKSDCLILDFTGLAGKHSLVGPVDVLAGEELGEDVALIAAELLEEGEKDIAAALERAHEIAAERAGQSALAEVHRWWSESVDPFIGAIEPEPSSDGRLATQKQRAYLAYQGLDDLPERLPLSEASRLIATLQARHARGLASFKQIRWLKRRGIDARALSKREASELMENPHGEVQTEGGMTETERMLALWSSLGTDERHVVLRIAERITKARKYYGELELSSDDRNFRVETTEELLDATAYLAMALLKAER